VLSAYNAVHRAYPVSVQSHLTTEKANALKMTVEASV